MAELLAPDCIVLCEGSTQDDEPALDESCYNKIFAQEFPGVLFVSVGSATKVEKRMGDLLPVLKKIVSATSIVRFRDRDALTPGEMVDKHTGDVRVMSGYRNIESMLLSDGVLSRLCDSLGKSDCFDAIRAARDTALPRAGVQHATDDLKPAAQAVHHAARSQLATDTLRRIEACIHARRACTSGDGRHARIRKAEGRHLRPNSPGLASFLAVLAQAVGGVVAPLGPWSRLVCEPTAKYANLTPEGHDGFGYRLCLTVGPTNSTP